MESHIVASLIFIATLVVVTNPQKVPPGVNPNTYQHQQQQQQYQQPPPPPQQVQYQQQPIQNVDVQYQQPPVQHHQPPPPQLHQPPPPQHHQPPPQQAGHGHDHHGQPQLLNAANLAEEREHMQEHLNVNIDTSKMSEQELQFHYFKMHDADNNNKLDGCELIKSLIHWHENEDKGNTADALKTDEEISFAVDNLLKSMDGNLDGYIDWVEFLSDKDK